MFYAVVFLHKINPLLFFFSHFKTAALFFLLLKFPPSSKRMKTRAEKTEDELKAGFLEKISRLRNSYMK